MKKKRLIIALVVLGVIVLGGLVAIYKYFAPSNVNGKSKPKVNKSEMLNKLKCFVHIFAKM